MRNLLYFFGIIIGIYLLAGCERTQRDVTRCEMPQGNITRCASVDKREIIAENDSVQIIWEVVGSANNQLDVPITALWIHNKSDGTENKLLQTVRPDSYSWYMGDEIHCTSYK